MNKRILYWVIGLILVAYMAFCAAVYVKPQWFFYNPNNNKADINISLSNGLKVQEVTYQAVDGAQLYAWIKAPQKGKKIIVFYHGNSYNIEKFYEKMKPLVSYGYGIFMPEYRGFGGIKGEITQQNLEQDAMAAIDYLHSLGYYNHQIVLYGMSLGSYMASYIASNAKRRYAGLILEVPFDSLLNVVKQRILPIFPFEVLIKDKYDNVANVKNINIPILIMAAENDKTVPMQRAEELFNQANEPKEMLIYQNAQHSNLLEHNNHQDILNWLKDIR